MRSPGSKIRVLCVEDCPATARLIELSLELETDIESVGNVSSTNEVLARVRETEPDVVTFDLMSSGAQTLSTIAELSKSHSGIRSILYTGMNDPEVVDGARAAGCAAYICKDRDFDDLLEAIREVAK